jgi:NTE family protein
MGDILDRRNELSGNLSREQELYFIHKVNDWVRKGVLPGQYRIINVEEISLQQDLALTSKLDRNPS